LPFTRTIALRVTSLKNTTFFEKNKLILRSNVTPQGIGGQLGCHVCPAAGQS
jgi:hypothetical protein